MKKIFFITILIVISFLGINDIAIAQGGLDRTVKAAQLDKYGSSIPEILSKVIGTGLSIIAVVFFILMLYAGVSWMLARGNEEQAGKALDTIIAAVIGLIIVLASYVITDFVFRTVKFGDTGTSSSQEVSGEVISPGCCRWHIPAGIGYGWIQGGERECSSICQEVQDADPGVQEMTCEFNKILTKDKCNGQGWLEL